MTTTTAAGRKTRGGRKPISLVVSERIQAAENFIILKGKQIKAGKKKGLDWAVQVKLKHWHEVGYGCTPTCLNDIRYVPDPDAKHWKLFRLKRENGNE